VTAMSKGSLMIVATAKNVGNKVNDCTALKATASSINQWHMLFEKL